MRRNHSLSHRERDMILLIPQRGSSLRLDGVFVGQGTNPGSCELKIALSAKVCGKQEGKVLGPDFPK